MIMLSPSAGPCIRHSYFLLTLFFQRTDHSHFFKTSHKEIISYPFNLEIILPVDLGDLHLYVSIVRTEVVIITVVILIPVIISNSILSVVISPLTALLIIAVITIIP